MDRPPIAVLRLVPVRHGEPPPALEPITKEHPNVLIALAARPGAIDAIIDARDWFASPDFAAFDDAVARSRSDAITVRGENEDLGAAAVEILTRWQRHTPRRNEASSTTLFEGVLRAHAALHDVSKPLVKADLDHAIDTLCWMLRLEPHATLTAQLAALFHDVERLESEADRRIEHRADDYAAFKDQHASRGAELAQEALRGAGVDRATAARVRDIIACHERRGRDPEVDLLNDADGLSFFSLNSAGYADYFGPEQTQKKVAYTLARLGQHARARLAGVRLRPDIAEHLRHVEVA